MKILHILKLRGIGGVQSQFEVFFKSLSLKQKQKNLIVNIGKIDKIYGSLIPFSSNHFKIILVYLFSNDVIIHSYNNLTSKKYNLIYKIFKPKKLIFHERGNAWNLSASKKQLVIENSKLSKLVICNSEATKIILNKKFNIEKNKLVVIYNGVLSDHMIKQAKVSGVRPQNQKYIIGYVGRLETNKGVQSLIESMTYLDNDIYELHIIGDGSLLKDFEDFSSELNIKSIKFFGRVKEAWSEMKNFDLIIVPSIREPLGNVVIEAALQKVPIIASKVDGIVEIIDNNISGILIKPSVDVNKRFITESVPLPEYVVDVENERLIKPMQLDPEKLAESIKYMHDNQDIANVYREKSYTKVVNKFNIKNYNKKLFDTYESVLKS